MVRCSLLLVALLSALLPSCHGADVSNGWGDAIAWKSLAEGTKEAAATGKPLMLIIHKSWCGACKALRPKFAASKEIQALSVKFVMVNTLDDDEPADKKFKPDGGYIPRIFFTHSTGEVMGDINGPNAKYKHFFSDAGAVTTAMVDAIAKAATAPPTKDEL